MTANEKRVPPKTETDIHVARLSASLALVSLLGGHGFGPAFSLMGRDYAIPGMLDPMLNVSKGFRVLVRLNRLSVPPAFRSIFWFSPHK